jgi:hypothetical protein
MVHSSKGGYGGNMGRAYFDSDSVKRAYSHSEKALGGTESLDSGYELEGEAYK